MQQSRKKSGTAGEFDSETLTWTGASRTAVFVASAQARASKIVVTVATGAPKQSPTVEISATELEVNGAVATATVTTDGPAVTLSTSDPAVASVSGTTVTAVAAGTATITATWEEDDTYVGGTKTFTVTVTANTPVSGDKYVKVTSTADITDGEYLIVYEEGSVAFNGGLETLDAASNTIEVVLNNNEIAVTNETTAAEFKIDVTAGTLKSASGYYIGQTSDANGLASSATEAYTNTLSFDTDGNANIVSSGGAYLRYNSASNQARFRYYKSTSYTGQKAIQLYKKVSATPEPITITISAAGYSTLYYGTKNLTVPEGMEAYTVKVTTKVERSTTYEAGDVIPAGTGVVLKAAQGTYEFAVAAEAGAKDANNMLHGNDVKTTTTGGTYYYALTLNANKDIDSAGFYWMKENGAAYEAGAHKAYLALDKTFTELAEGTETGVKGFLALPGDGIVTGIDSVNTGSTSEIYNLAGQRLQKLQRGVNIVNGKKVMVK